MRVAIVPLAALICAVAAAARAPALTGRVTIASTEPQCSPKRCSAPVGPITLRFTRKRARSRAQPTASGAFRAWLPAGTCRVSSGKDGAAISPAQIALRAGVTRRVTFVLRLDA